jgi:thiol-disulfide isomerase/thioredoxin
MAFTLLLALAGCMRTSNASAAGLSLSHQENKVYSKDMLYGTINAPEFPSGAQWLNSDPLTVSGLRGKVILLDFWTYCCINCMHVIPDLRRLEHEFDDSLVVIGVHSAKFNNEQETGNIRNAILRYDVEHPIVNDASMRIWDEYAVRSWPTFVLIDPAGKIIGQTSGEGVYDQLHNLIAAVISEHEKAGKLHRSKLQLKPERDQRPPTLLSYPGKIAADEAGRRLFISDSGHHRIVVVGLDGTVQAVIGSGEQGLADGSFSDARFHHPQGMAYDATSNSLYIADTESHALRRADLTAQTVSTLRGDGQQAGWQDVGERLNSPWDLQLLDGILYIAMAGPHQLYSYDPASDRLELFAGSGHENIVDGPRLGAALAQPSGITTDGTGLFFADSEVSAIRSATPGAAGRVGTLIGHGLFDFGDIDGTWDAARLQHCLGVDYHSGALYVADSYNHKIKRLDIQARTCETLIGTGQPGFADGNASAAQLDEPNDVAWASGLMYIADTNNSVIRTYDPQTRSLGTFALRGLDKMAASMPTDGKAATAQFPGVTLPLNGGTLVIDLHLPSGTHLNELQAPIVSSASTDPGVTLSDAVLVGESLRIPVNVTQARSGGFSSTLTLDLAVCFCDLEGSGQCFLDRPVLSLPLSFDRDTDDTEAHINYNVKM